MKCPSIGSRISTCEWTVVHMMSTRSGSTHCRSVDPEDTVDIPMMQDEGRLVLDRVLHGRSHHRSLAVLLVDVERLISSEQKRLGWDVLMGSLTWIVVGDRYVRLNGETRRGLRGIENGRLSGAPW